MESFTIRDLGERTGELVRNAEQGKLAVVAKHGHPLFVAVPLDEQLLRFGVGVALAVKLIFYTKLAKVLAHQLLARAIGA